MPKRKDGWSSDLARPIVLRDGTRLETLSDARGFILSLPEADQMRQAWQTAAGDLVEVAEGRGDLEGVTKQIERALFLQLRWFPK
jgi:hypothetical protein